MTVQHMTHSLSVWKGGIAVTEIRVVSGDLLENGRRGDVYTIPTRGNGKLLPLQMIKYFVRVFLDHARTRPDDTFRVTLIGVCRQYKPPQIAPFFDYAPDNVLLPYEFIY